MSEVGPSDEVSNSSLNTPRHPRGGTTRRNFLIAAGKVVGGAVVGTVVGDNLLEPIAKKLIEGSCYKPTAKELADVAVLVDRPPIAPHDETGTEYKQRRFDAAKRNGLTLYDWENIYRPLADDLYRHDGKEPQYHFDTYFAKAKEFLKQYGVQLLLTKPHGDYKKDERPLTAQERESAKIKDSILTLTRSVGNLPVELLLYKNQMADLIC